jgi:hypothetical protein
MAFTRASDPANAGDMTPGVGPIPYPDITRAVAAIVAAIGEVKASIDTHRTALEQLTARVDALAPAAPVIDPVVVRSHTLLQRSFSSSSNGTQSANGAQVQAPPAGQGTSAR